MTYPRSLPLVALVLALAFGVLVLQARIVAGGKTWDDVRYHTEIAPPRLAAAEQALGGAVPMWWEGSGLGVPLASEPSHGAMYPPLWLAGSPRVLDLLLVLHLAWAALGVALWARRQKATDQAALVAGLLVATTGLLGSTAIRGALPALAHLPWVGVVAGALADATDRRGRARMAIALALLVGAIGLAGELAVLVHAVAITVVAAPGPRPRGWLAAAITGGFAIASALWLPALIAAGDGAGAAVSPMPLARLVELIVPGTFGSYDPDRAVAALAGASPWAPSIYVGVTLLALAAVVTPLRRVLALIAGLVVLVLVSGRGGWPVALGAPELHLAALVLVLAPRAALGIDALLDGKRRAVMCLGAGVAFGVVALAALGVLRGRNPEAATAIDRALLEGGLALACSAGAVAAAWKGSPRAIPLVIGMLVGPGFALQPAIAPATPRALVTEASRWIESAARVPRPARVFRPVIMPDVPDTLEDAVGTLRGTWPWRFGLAAGRSEDPARIADHDPVWLAAAREGGALLDRFGISVAILPSTVATGNKMTELARRGAWSLVQLPVAPPAAVLRGWRWAVAPRDAMDLMFAAGGGTNVLRGTVVLKGRGESRDDRGPPIPCDVERWAPGAIDVTCDSPTDGYAVVSSSAVAGWTVTVDGEPEYWQVADVLRRAVEIRPGAHRISWRYAAPGARVGRVIAAIAILGLIALWLGTRKPPPPDDVN